MTGEANCTNITLRIILFFVLSFSLLSQQLFAVSTENTMPESKSGYYRFADIYEDRIVFVAEDDLWLVEADGGDARRLTTRLATVTTPRFSPDGRQIAFVGSDDGAQEVYIMPAEGGAVRRVTYLGAMCQVVGWDGECIIFCDTYGQPFRQPGWLYRVKPDGTQLQRLNYGPANRISAAGSMIILGRHNGDPARWKRYRGGTAGELLIDPDGKGQFRELIVLKGNMADPMCVGGRIFFLSDQEGIGNLYSCRPDGGDIHRHTDHQEFYARNAVTDGRRIVYTCGADIFLLDPAVNRSHKVDIRFYGSWSQTARKFVESKKYLEDYALTTDGAFLAVVCRGKSFTFGCWDGAVVQQGVPDGVRYRLTRPLNDGKRVVVASDTGGEDHLEIHWMYNEQPPNIIQNQNLGRPMDIKVSPTADATAIVNHRNEIWRIDLKSGVAVLIDRDEHHPIESFNWSPDGRWLAYGCHINLRQSVIKVHDAQNNKTRPITRPVLRDHKPVFDPGGKYLYFLSSRIFDPVYDKLHFDLGFPRGMRPYAISLTKDLGSPFIAEPEGFQKKKTDGACDTADSDKSKKSENKTDTNTVNPVVIDFDGIENRIVAFPVEEGIYDQIAATKNRVFYTILPVEGPEKNHWSDRAPPEKASLKVYDLKKREESIFAEKIADFKLSSDGTALALRVGNRLRVVDSDAEKLDDKTDCTRKTGWIDLDRVKISVDPPAEWRQMLAEAWRLQCDYFWKADMSGVDWPTVLKRYLPLVDRISCRSEFADLIWEMQGELGTSHTYEMGGDYRQSPKYPLGLLGADLACDPRHNAWRIDHIVRGDAWDPENAPPLMRPGVNASEGMLITVINGRPVDLANSPAALLVNQAEQEVSLTLAQSDGSNPRRVTVKPLKDESRLRYREWVENNRRWVHEKGGNRIGYLHIPDMSPWGYAEFHRYFLVELDHDGLIVDVRFNGGGHVSQLLLEKLSRRRLGYGQARWTGTTPYPDEAPKGPMACLTNEFAGSDGDIISQVFKQQKLGPLIGRRTWGGVIGIWPRNTLVDGTITTQPEFSSWFEGVGWSIENYGVDPDIDVNIMPQDWAAGRDTQLERALEEVLKIVESRPADKKTPE
jgi:tricorn protease